MLTVVFDTNVLLSASLLPTSTPARAVGLALRNGRLVTSVEVLAEVQEVVRRPRFDRYTPLAERLQFVQTVAERATLVTIEERIVACRDSDDDKFLELAVNGRATHLVTGDADLLALHPFRDIAILTAADFVAAAPGTA